MLHAHEYSGAWSEKPEGPASGTAGAGASSWIEAEREEGTSPGDANGWPAPDGGSAWGAKPAGGAGAAAPGVPPANNPGSTSASGGLQRQSSTGDEILGSWDIPDWAPKQQEPTQETPDGGVPVAQQIGGAAGGATAAAARVDPPSWAVNPGMAGPPHPEQRTRRVELPPLTAPPSNWAPLAQHPAQQPQPVQHLGSGQYAGNHQMESAEHEPLGAPPPQSERLSQEAEIQRELARNQFRQQELAAQMQPHLQAQIGSHAQPEEVQTNPLHNLLQGQQPQLKVEGDGAGLPMGFGNPPQPQQRRRFPEATKASADGPHGGPYRQSVDLLAARQGMTAGRGHAGPRTGPQFPASQQATSPRSVVAEPQSRPGAKKRRRPPAATTSKRQKPAQRAAGGRRAPAPAASALELSCDERAASLGVWADVACNPTTQALTPEVVSELLSDSDFCPGARPVCFAAGEHTSWIFKEGPGFHTRKKAASGRGADRWHNSGGAKAARKLPQENPVVCRRYGSLAQQNGQKFRYHEYCLVTPTDQNDYIEEREVTLFHLMLPTPPSPRVSPAPSSRGRSRSRPVRTQI